MMFWSLSQLELFAALRTIALTWGLLFSLGIEVRGEESPIDHFERSVRPILSQNCFSCHGEGKQWNGLRLDSREAMVRGGDSGPAVIPGDSTESLLIQAIRRGGDLKMPPEKPLTPDQISSIVRWVEEGAVWSKSESPSSPKEKGRSHWAFQPMASPDVPKHEDPWIRNPIDSFVYNKLQENGLHPNSMVDRRRLFRRLSYVLRGLPPQFDELHSFLEDNSPDAYEVWVDRFLESPQFGEQWARRWLDIARYSDTKGYVYAREEKSFVHASSYRDWVVEALNEDLPYDRFLSYQLAADQLVPEEKKHLAAMGFLTLGRRFLGVTQDIIDDRIDVVCRGMMGLTVGCARCHDHKYDPIPTADYYSLYGVFASCQQIQEPIEGVPESKGEAYLAFEKELQERQKKLDDSLRKSRDDASERIRNRFADYLYSQTELAKYPEESFGQILTPNDMIPVIVHRWEKYLDRKSREKDSIFRPWRWFVELPSDASLDDFARTSERIQSDVEGNLPIHPRIRELFADPPRSLREVADRYGEFFKKVRERSKGGVESEGLDPQSALETLEWRPLLDVLYGQDSPCVIPDEAIISIESMVDTKTCESLWKLQGEVDRWLIQSPWAPKMASFLIDRPSSIDARILKRGNPSTPGDIVPRRFLSRFSAEGERFTRGSGRSELAEKIASPSNPLTARVWVNRIWQHTFGVGLVRTPSDFGLRAEPPSHPELLDWLAQELIRNRWSTKAILRQILLSSAFQQDSLIDNESKSKGFEKIDPENRFLWKMNSKRLTFEEMRDSMLVSSGELDHRFGGKSLPLFPKGSSELRRSLYGFIDRQFLPTTLRTFDFANPDLPIATRPETTVPQQSLFVLNHPFVADRARGMIQRLERESPKGSTQEKVNALFQWTLQRKANTGEMENALTFLEASEDVAPKESSDESHDWHYGYVVLDLEQEKIGPLLKLPYYSGTAWQGSATYPDPQLGWLQLTAQGGHPGNNHQHAVVRRWKAPASMAISLQSTVEHAPEVGDGIRCWIFSSQRGKLDRFDLHHRKEPWNRESLRVTEGETLDFVVDIKDQLNSDQFLWRIEIVSDEENQQGKSRRWDSSKDFRGPVSPVLNVWEQLAQVLLLSNETLFVD